MKESELSQPIQTWLEGQGYQVHAEVKDFDLLGRKGEEIVGVELKTAFSLTLVYQAVERQQRCDSVYMAIPAKGASVFPPRFREMKSLCRRLGLGLILVRFLKRSTRVELVLHPDEFEPRRSHHGRRAIIREVDGRYAEFTPGGISSKVPRMTSYRQQALLCAHLLDHLGPLGPAALVKAGGPARSQIILSGNVFGWFDKVRRGVYCLGTEGKAALELHAEQRHTIATAAEAKKKA